MKVKEIIQETTTSGSIATVVANQGSMMYRNPSVFDEPSEYNEPRKYKNTKKDEGKVND